MTAHNRHSLGEPTTRSDRALLLIDVVNDLEFPEAEGLLAAALPMADRIVALKRRLKSEGVPAIYLNDNFGRWRSDFTAQVRHCLEDDVRGRPLVEKLKPEKDDYFVLKPKHSGFFSTTLELLLDHLGTKTVIVTGVAGNICVLFTANDAYMRDYLIRVPADCVASNTPEENEAALRLMQTILKADIRPSAGIAGGS